MNNAIESPVKIKKELNSLAENPSEVELIKDKSRNLRGTIVESLADKVTGAVTDDDTQLIKFHGIYQQDDRDNRQERLDKKLEPDYSFMIRVRMPGGKVSAHQWQVMDELASSQTIQTLKLTTRQAIQLHGILKGDLKKTIQGFNKALLDSIAACGDVNRNVMCSPVPQLSATHAEVYTIADEISLALLPSSNAYHEIWLDGEKLEDSKEEIEPLYGKHYLPRKFKIAIAIPPHNDVDIYANDIGLTAIEKDGALVGFNVAIGGGMGMTHGREDTYPRLASEIGFVPKDKIVEVCKEVLGVQRDYGNRTDRKQARLKYTIDRLGLDVFKAELEKRLGYQLEQSQKAVFISNGDVYGWVQGTDGLWYLTLHIEHGRVKDTADYKLKSGLREVANLDCCDFRLTGNQNLVLGAIRKADRPKVEAVLSRFGIEEAQQELSGLRKNSIACVALNTCSLAMAEAERYLPALITKIEAITTKYGLYNDDIVIRMTGCPNGCGRPYLGEIGFVGKAMGRYNMYLGAGFYGERLNKLYKENIDEAEILKSLEPLIADYATHRSKGERFGDFVIRRKWVIATEEGKDFHQDTGQTLQHP